jgi:hypothetical protein
VKHVVLLAGRGGAGDALADAVVDEARRCAETEGVTVEALRQVPRDPFGEAVPGMRPFEATIDLRGDDDEAIRAAITRMSQRLESVVHADMSGVHVGVDNVVIPCDPTPVRYQYVMRRKIATTHEQYIDHYANKHSRFGLITPGIEGYTQFHVDADASRVAAAIAGFGVWGADSISELHLASVETFMSALAGSNPGPEAGEDEDRFVDRGNSVMFTSAVIWRS